MASGTNGNGEKPTFDKQFWESRIELDKIKRRAEVHARLKQEYLRCVHNPYNNANWTPLVRMRIYRRANPRSVHDFMHSHHTDL